MFLILGGLLVPTANSVSHAREPRLPAMFYRSAAGVIQAQRGRLHARFEPGRVTYAGPYGPVTMRLLGARSVAPQGLDGGRGKLNFIHGNEPANWRSGIELFNGVAYKEVYPGVDLVYRGSESGIKSEYIIRAGADSAQIRLLFGGGTVRLNDGQLTVSLPGGDFNEKQPEAYQDSPAGRRTVNSAYSEPVNGVTSFHIGPYDHSRDLVIDPDVSFSTLWGGSLNDGLTGVATGPDGSVYVCGWTESTDVPVATAVSASQSGSLDAFVMKLSPSNTVAYATYFGGSGFDQANGISVDSSGNAFIAGVTASKDFPTYSPLQSRLRGYRNAFVVMLGSDGGLGFSSYLGGSGSDAANGIAVESTGYIYVAGQTTSPDFPVVGAVQSQFQGATDAFVAKIAPFSAVIYSTYLGGASTDRALAIAVRAGEVYVTGATESPNFPTFNAFQAALQGGQDAFVTKLDAQGALAYSTYLGGSNGGVGSEESGHGIVVSNTGEAIVAGTTSSLNFPTAAALQPALAGGNDVFIARLFANGSGLRFSTFWGGSSYDTANGVALDAAGNIYVTGDTSSINFPALNGVQGNNAGLYDGFLTSFTPAGDVLRFSSYWGGNNSDHSASVAVDSGGNPVLAGHTQSSNFPLSGALRSFASGSDGFITRFNLGLNRPRIGVYRNGLWLLNNGQQFWFGIPGDIPVIGDWDGTGRMRIGVYRKGQWLVDLNGNNQWDGLSVDKTFSYGIAGDIPVIGDWDGSGRMRIGVYRAGSWFADLNGNFQWDGPGVDRNFSFGIPGDVPVIGDWDGSGRMRIGIYRSGQWYMDVNGNLQWDGPSTDALVSYGIPGDIPVTGDWNGSGRTRIGVYRNGQWLVDTNGNNQWDGSAIDSILYYGIPSDVAVPVKW